MSRYLIEESSLNSPILTAVIPVANLHSNIQNLKSTLENAAKFNIKVITVIDLAAQDYSQPDLCIAEITKFSTGGLHKVVHGSFGNPGTARNFGKNLCETPWITFWDADDQPNCFAISNSLRLNRLNSEAIIGSYEIISSKWRKTITSESLEDVAINPGFWRILFATDCIAKVEFPSQRMGEDQLFLIRSKLHKLNIVFANEVFYSYNVLDVNRLSNNLQALSELGGLIRQLDSEMNLNQADLYIKLINFRLRFSQMKYAEISKDKLRALQSLPWTFIFSWPFLRVLTKLIK